MSCRKTFTGTSFDRSTVACTYKYPLKAKSRLAKSTRFKCPTKSKRNERTLYSVLSFVTLGVCGVCFFLLKSWLGQSALGGTGEAVPLFQILGSMDRSFLVRVVDL